MPVGVVMMVVLHRDDESQSPSRFWQTPSRCCCLLMWALVALQQAPMQTRRWLVRALLSLLMSELSGEEGRYLGR